MVAIFCSEKICTGQLFFTSKKEMKKVSKHICLPANVTNIKNFVIGILLLLLLASNPQTCYVFLTHCMIFQELSICVLDSCSLSLFIHFLLWCTLQMNVSPALWLHFISCLRFTTVYYHKKLH